MPTHTSIGPKLVDFVTTPLSDFIVIEYADTEFPKLKHKLTDWWDFTGDYIFKASREKDYTENDILDFFNENPEAYVEEELIKMNGFELPAGRIGEILKEDSILNLARYHWNKAIRSNARLREQGIMATDPNLDAYIIATKSNVLYSTLNQFIRRSSKNRLQFPYESPPASIIMADSKKGFAIIDNGINAN
jgi:hypothetical protein